jgi:hypothetical protein
MLVLGYFECDECVWMWCSAKGQWKQPHDVHEIGLVPRQND